MAKKDKDLERALQKHISESARYLVRIKGHITAGEADSLASEIEEVYEATFHGRGNKGRTMKVTHGIGYANGVRNDSILIELSGRKMYYEVNDRVQTYAPGAWKNVFLGWGKEFLD